MGDPCMGISNRWCAAIPRHGNILYDVYICCNSFCIINCIISETRRRNRAILLLDYVMHSTGLQHNDFPHEHVDHSQAERNPLHEVSPLNFDVFICTLNRHAIFHLSCGWALL